MIEWMPDENEIDGFVDGCEHYDRNYVLDRWGKLAQRKLLEYLIAHEAIGVSVEDNEDDEIMMVEVETLKLMLKQLEEK